MNSFHWLFRLGLFVAAFALLMPLGCGDNDTDTDSDDQDDQQDETTNGNDGNDATRIQETRELIQIVEGALEDYRHNHHPRNHYPPDQGDEPYTTAHIVEILRELDMVAFQDRHVAEFGEGQWQLVDAWGNPLRYREWRSEPTPPEDARNPRRFDLYSAGPDGEFGTDDDIGNWSTSTVDEESD